MPKKQNLIGKKFNRWTVIKEIKISKYASRWLCKCDCGNYGIHKTGELNFGTTKSCGCLQKENSSIKNKKHGLRKSKLYSVWNTMKFRCYNKNSPSYQNYGGRGITICNEWKNDFCCFYKWAMNNGYKEGLSIDRINNNLGYSPNNCRFVDNFIQSNNTRKNVFISYNGETHSVSEWARIVGVSHDTIIWRYKKYGVCEKLFYPGNLRSARRMLQLANEQSKRM